MARRPGSLLATLSRSRGTMRQPGRAARRETVAHYGRQHGPLAEQSLEAYVVHLWRNAVLDPFKKFLADLLPKAVGWLTRWLKGPK